MRLLGLLPVLALFILLGGVQEPELVEGFFGKKCPQIKVPCVYREMEQCGKKKPCPKKMTCCNFNCGKKCLDLNEEICSLPKDIGLCLAKIPRWWYDKEKKGCSRFYYGGCSGNNNNFQSYTACNTICPGMCD